MDGKILYVATFSVALSLELAIAPGVFSRTLSASMGSSNSSQDWQVSLTFEPPDDEGAPAGTGGTASRGPNKCYQDDSPESEQLPDENQSKPFLIPLMPDTGAGLTVSAYPTFFTYISKTAIEQVEFNLYSWDGEQYQPVYQTTFTLSETPGIVSVSLPAAAPPLEVGRDYTWELKLICDPQNRSIAEPSAQGWIRRTQISPTLQRLENSSPLERAAAYAKNGIWYEALTTLADLRRSQPNNFRLRNEWQEFLQSVGLSTVADQPLIESK